MWKAALAGVAMIAVAGTTLVEAQQRRPDDAPRNAETIQRWQPSAEDVSAFADARIAALKAAMRLTPEQEKNWPAVENALRDLAKQRIARMEARRGSTPPTDPIERMRQRAQTMAQAATGLQQLADAAGPLYATLDDAQKRRLTAVMGRRYGMGPGHRMGRWGGQYDSQGWWGPGRGHGGRWERL